MATCKLSNILLIDNTVNNLGVAGSLNVGIDQMRRDNSDWLIPVSPALRFGPRGGLDFIEQLEEYPHFAVLEAEKVFGWHLIAWSRSILDLVGRFDENFYPYGWDDLDWSWRYQMAMKVPQPVVEPLWTKVPVDVQDTGMAHSINLAGIRSNPDLLIRYYTHKWGGMTGHEIYERPFGNPVNPIAYWPTLIGGPAQGRWDT